jgi:hypothetical protein
MEEVMKQRLTSRNLWTRALYMLFFVLAYGIAEAVVAVVVIVQFIFLLISGRANENLLVFGNNLSTYVRQILQFQTFNSEHLAYPFGDWPDEGLGSAVWLEETLVRDEEITAPVAAPDTTEPGRTDDGPMDTASADPAGDSEEGSSEPQERDPKA